MKLPSSFLRPTFSMDLSVRDRVFYTRSDGLRPRATMVGAAEDGLLHLEYYQDGLRPVNLLFAPSAFFGKRGYYCPLHRSVEKNCVVSPPCSSYPLLRMES